MSAAHKNTMMTFAPTVAPLPNNLQEVLDPFDGPLHNNLAYNENHSYQTVPAAVGIQISTILNLPITNGLKIQPFPIVSSQNYDGIWTYQAIVS